MEWCQLQTTLNEHAVSSNSLWSTAGARYFQTPQNINQQKLKVGHWRKKVERVHLCRRDTNNQDRKVPCKSRTYFPDDYSVFDLFGLVAMVIRSRANETLWFKVFVANRVSCSAQWRYVDTGSNPADMDSRDVKVDVFIADATWVGLTSFCILRVNVLLKRKTTFHLATLRSKKLLQWMLSRPGKNL